MTDPRYLQGESIPYHQICQLHEQHFKAECKKHEKRRFKEIMPCPQGRSK